MGAVLAVGIGVVVVYLLHDDYGITWDEPVQSIYGDLVRAYFVSGGSDRRCDSFLNLRYYGPLADLVPSMLRSANDLAKYDLRHMVCGLFSLVALAATWRLARRTGGPLAGLVAVLVIATMPRFVGHAFDNLKDVPFAAAVAVFVLTVGQLCVGRGALFSRVVWAGLAAGFVLAVRPGGFPLVALLLVTCLVIAEVTVGAIGRGRGRLAASFFGVLGLGWVVMVLPWPYAHRDPLWHPIEAMVVAGSFPYVPDVLFDGAVVPSVDLPRSYIARMLMITTPPAVLVLALVGLAHMVRLHWSRPRSRAACIRGIVAAWVLVPLVTMAIAHPNVYDGIRHVLFILPGIAVLAGVGSAALVARRRGWTRAVWAAGIGIAVLSVGVDLVRLHPYQTTYFNGLVGGLAGAEGRFDTDYWVSSYREAFGWVNERAAREPERSFRVLVAGTPYLELLAELYRAPNVQTRVVDRMGPERRLPEGIDYSIATSRWGFARQWFPDSPVVHSIGREGAAFTVIRGARPS